MDFEVSELTQQVAQTARDFALQHIKPYIMKWDEAQEFPAEVFKKLGELGLMVYWCRRNMAALVYRILNTMLLSRKSQKFAVL